MATKQKKIRLRLFVWDGFSPDYTGGLACAIAKDETEARQLIIECHGYNPSEWGTLTIHPLSRKMAKARSGGG